MAYVFPSKLKASPNLPLTCTGVKDTLGVKDPNIAGLQPVASGVTSLGKMVPSDQEATRLFGFGFGGKSHQPHMALACLLHQRLVLLLPHRPNDDIEVRFGHLISRELIRFGRERNVRGRHQHTQFSAARHMPLKADGLKNAVAFRSGQLEAVFAPARQNPLLQIGGVIMRK